MDPIEDGKQWYETANTLAHAIGNGDIRLGAGLLAAISPQMPWERNVRLAFAVAEDNDFSGLTGDKIAKCKLMLAGVDPWLVLRGMKVRSFYANIVGHLEYVTIDTWMLKYCNVSEPINTSKASDRKGRAVYKRCSDRIKREAKRHGVLPAIWQAIVWCKLRSAV